MKAGFIIMKITLLNRYELLLTRDLKVLNDTLCKLQSKNIDYKVVTNSLTNPGRSHGIPFINSDSAYEYRVYINKKDKLKIERI